MNNHIQTIQDLAHLINKLAIKNRKENGVYNVTLASLSGILLAEIERINQFLEEEGYKTLYKWELLSPTSVYAELENSHKAINLNEFFNTDNIDESLN
ncbi:hypothetical protein IMCC3317_31340 [Kordia antarctica]|uniref:Uncharacterized protein n=1 Tax=Kordia antarctica TaxID=1218801 RepID=A0A7L4ZM31_9FLAO|nr:hypothetical protein [Kordia antarctica]QHI37753.1 hypothetical protein IMCC3317_31340 [Kordia antarctica]